MLRCEIVKNAHKALVVHLCEGHKRKGYSAHYEHGQLWVVGVDGDTYSVNDAEGRDTWDGFGFEEITGKREIC